MCGKSDASHRALVEGVELTVCEKCSRFGKVLVSPRVVQRRSYGHAPKREESELLEYVAEDASSKIKAKREQLKMTQQEFAKMVSEKESLIHHIELNASHLSLDVAKRLERMLNLPLVEKAKEALIQKSTKKQEAFTLGDYIRVKK